MKTTKPVPITVTIPESKQVGTGDLVRAMETDYTVELSADLGIWQESRVLKLTGPDGIVTVRLYDLIDVLKRFQ